MSEPPRKKVDSDWDLPEKTPPETPMAKMLKKRSVRATLSESPKARFTAAMMGLGTVVALALSAWIQSCMAQREISQVHVEAKQTTEKAVVKAAVVEKAAEKTGVELDAGYKALLDKLTSVETRIDFMQRRQDFLENLFVNPNKHPTLRRLKAGAAKKSPPAPPDPATAAIEQGKVIRER